MIKIEHQMPPRDRGGAGCGRGIDKAVLNAPGSGVPHRPFGAVAQAPREAAEWMEDGLPERWLRPEYERRVPRPWPRARMCFTFGWLRPDIRVSLGDEAA